MRSEKTTDIFGNEKTVHYDDCGRKVGETRIEKDWLGNEKAVHYDQYGRKTGTSEVRSGFFGDKVEHFDQYGHKIGESRDESNWFGDKTVHYDRYGRKTGESREESGIFRGDYTSTRGSAGGYYPGWPSGRGGNGSSGGGGSSGGSGGYSGGGSGGYSGGYAGEGGVTAAGVLITLLGLAAMLLLFVAYFFLVEHSEEVIGVIRRVVGTGLCPLVTVICLVRFRARAGETAAQRRARSGMIAWTTLLFLALELCFLRYTDPAAEGSATEAFRSFLLCWAPKLVYAIAAGIMTRRGAGEDCRAIYGFASAAFGLTCGVMELTNALAGSEGELLGLLIYLLPALLVLYGVIWILSWITGKVYQAAAGGA